MVKNGKVLGDLVIGLSMDGTQMAKTLDEMRRVTKMATSEMKANLSVMSNAGDKYGFLEAKISGLTKTMDAQETELVALKTKHKDMIGTYGENSKQAVKVASDINNLVRKQAAYGKELTDTEVKMKEYQRGTADVKQELGLMERSVAASVSVLKAQGKEFTAGVIQLQNSRKQHELQTKVVQDEKAKLEDLTKAKDADNLETKQQAVVVEEAVAKQKLMGTSIENLEKKYGKMDESSAKFRDQIEQSNEKLEKFSQKTGDVGKKITTHLGAPVAGAMMLGAKAAIDYESHFASVTKTVDGTAKELDGLSDGIRKMALDVPTSASDLAELAAMAGQLGIKTPSIEGFTRVIADLGVATNLTGEEGAAQLAKFANITKMSQKDFDRLGSSIVDLGNHYATTEASIMDMAMRLAGAGTQIGLSQSDILGLSASLSSVGIEAEMGGSAISKVMVNMQVATKLGISKVRELESATGMTRRELELMSSNSSKDFKAVADSLGMTSTEVNKIIKSGKDLENFSKISGMSASQFKKAFEEDAVGAIGSFINGLGTAEKQGTSAIEMLNEMGISEVRLRDSLLRAGNANELFSSAVDRSSQAWKSNTALTKEAETRYATTESQLKLLKNAANELGIQFGRMLIPELTKIVKSFSGFIKHINDMDDSTKRMILTAGKLAIATGPVLIGVSKITSGMMMLNTFGAKSSLMLKLFSKNSAATAITAAKLATGMTSAGTAATGLGTATTVAAGSSLAAIAPFAAAAAGVVAVGAAAYYGTKKYNEFKAKQEETAEKVEKFGTDVSDSTAKAADGFLKMRDEADTQLTLLETATAENGQKISKQIVNNFSGMAEEVVKQLTKTKDKATETMNGIQLELGESGKNWQKNIVEAVGDSFDNDIQDVSKAKDRINELLKEAEGNLQNLSGAQREEFNTLYQFVGEKTSVFAQNYKDLDGMADSWSERKGQIDEKTFKKEIESVKKQRDKVLKETDKSHKTMKDQLDRLLATNKISQKDYNIAIEGLDAQRNAQKAKANAAYARAESALGKHLKNTSNMNIATLKTAEESKKTIHGEGEKWYNESQEKWYNSEKEWLAATKKQNAEILANSEGLTKGVKKSLDEYEKSQKKAYEELGKSGSEAAEQAEKDRKNLENELTKTGAMLLEQSKKARNEYLEGLKGKDEGQVAEVAKKWGLDLSNETEKIDFGKYGEKTAKEFFEAFQSGSKDGAEMAKIYFGDKLAEITEKDLSKVGKADVATLREGLKSGALSLNELKDHFNKNILALFPDDLSQLGKSEIASLKQGIKDGKIDTEDVKNKFFKELDNIFKKDLSQWGKEDIKTFQDGLKFDVTSKEELKEQYAEALKNIFNQDMSNLSKQSISSLKTGIELGIPECQQAMDVLMGSVKSKAQVDLGEKGKFTMKSLWSAYETGKIDIDTFMNGYQQFMKNTSDLNLNPQGQGTVRTLKEGMEAQKPQATKEAKSLANKLINNLQIFGPAEEAGKKGVLHLGTGIKNNSKTPEKNAKGTATNVIGYFNKIIGGSNSMSEQFGGNSTLKSIALPKYAKGTGAVSRDHFAITGDGGKPELIEYPNGKMVLSPDTDTLTYLKAGSKVYNGGQTEQIMNLSKKFGMLPRYEKGTGANILDWFGGKVESLFEYVTQPLKAWGKIINGAFNIEKFTGASGRDIGLGSKVFAEKQSSWIEKLMKSVSASPPGAGAERWRSHVIRALSMNGLPTTANYVNAWLRQIQSESGGNEKAVQNGYVDVNTVSGDLAKGLLQTISATFNANKFPGHGNIMNGFDNMLAAMNYAKNRYGAAGMLGVIGHGHGYANGGFVSQHQVAEIAEGNKTEVIIPLDPLKRTRAVNLLRKTSEILNVEGGTQVVVQNNGGAVANEVEMVSQKLDQMIAVFSEFTEMMKSGAMGVFIDQVQTGKVMLDTNDALQGQKIGLMRRGIIT